jgi:hypothetical protein
MALFKFRSWRAIDQKTINKLSRESSNSSNPLVHQALQPKN